MNVTEVAPAGTVTVAGGTAALTVEPRLTTSGAVGAGLTVRVPVAVAVDMTVAGLTARLDGTLSFALDGLSVSVPSAEIPFAVAVTVTLVEAVTVFVVAAKVPVAEPAGIVTLAGTVTAALPLDRLTTMAAGGATRSVTVPVDPCPPRIVTGLNASEAGPMGVTVMAPFAVVPLTVAVMLPLTVDATDWVAIVNVWLVAPAATVIVVGGTAALTVEARFTTIGASDAIESVTVPVAGRVPVTDEGLTATVTGTGCVPGFTVSVPCVESPLTVAVTETFVDAPTLIVVAGKFAEVEPAGTVTLAGTPTARSPLVRVTTVAAGGAAARVIVPVELCPLTTAVGLNVKEAGPTGVTVMAPVAVPPFRVAVMVPLAVDATACVAMLKVWLVEPAGTVTVAGGTAALIVDERLTTWAEVGATLSVIVPVAEVEPMTLDGVMVRLDGTVGLTVTVA